MLSVACPSRRLISLDRLSSSQWEDGPAVDETLLQRIARGDDAAVSACIDQYSGLVWSLARKLFLSGPDAEDAVQDVFVDLWKNAGRFDPGVASETTFVAMIARRRLIDRIRKMERRPNEASLDAIGAMGSGADSEPSTDVSDEAQRALVALGQLSPDQQRVLRMSIVHGLSHEKISQATGLPLGTVKTHARRGLIRVRELLADTSGREVSR